ncbi:hypothetical protein CN378_03495 [Bacillus sp. AFS015802]|nr:hypothetical protein CN378_03495 [Bacillus sp. AFS015802]
MLPISANLEEIEKPLRSEQIKWNLHVKFNNPEVHAKAVVETSSVIQNSEERKKSLLNELKSRKGKMRLSL